MKTLTQSTALLTPGRRSTDAQHLMSFGDIHRKKSLTQSTALLTPGSSANQRPTSYVVWGHPFVEEPSPSIPESSRYVIPIVTFL